MNRFSAPGPGINIAGQRGSKRNSEGNTTRLWHLSSHYLLHAHPAVIRELLYLRDAPTGSYGRFDNGCLGQRRYCIGRYMVIPRAVRAPARPRRRQRDGIAGRPAPGFPQKKQAPQGGSSQWGVGRGSLRSCNEQFIAGAARLVSDGARTAERLRWISPGRPHRVRAAITHHRGAHPSRMRDFSARPLSR